MYAISVVMSAIEDSLEVFNLESSTDRKWLLQIATNRGWIGNGEYLVRTGDIHILENPETVLIVCNRPFTNVPQRRWGSNPPTHAAGLANGQAVLISVAEFHKLDLENFVPAGQLEEKSDRETEPESQPHTLMQPCP